MSAPAWPLTGHEAAERAFLDALARARLHHGWLIEGAKGIGKAQLARRLAAYMLGARGNANHPLDIPPDDPVARKVIAEGHPDLRWLARRPDDKGKIPQDISVDEIRKLVAFFTLRPALGGWRVGVVDAVDELNQAGANALLKTLEAPPANCILILIHHKSTSLLPTVRSRCRRLQLDRLDDDTVRQVLAGHGVDGLDEAVRLARGRPGRGLALSEPSAMAAAKATRVLLGDLPRPSASALSSVIDRVGRDGDAFEAFQGEVLDWLAEQAEHAPAKAGRWLEIARILSDGRAANMEPGQLVAKVVSRVQVEDNTR